MVKKIVCLIIGCVMLFCSAVIASAAETDSKLLECFFSSDSKVLRLFLSENVSGNPKVMIGNKEYDAEIKNDVDVKTTFLIDNTISMPKTVREPMKQAITEYVNKMPENESVRIASFSQESEKVSDEFSRSSAYVKNALESLTFEDAGSYVYDAIVNATKTMFGDDDSYYRLVFITDSAVPQRGGSASFELVRSVVEKDSRYHIDFIQVARDTQATENRDMTALAALSSNTYNMLTETKNDISYLTPQKISMLKVKMDNSLTTGEYKGVSIKNGSEIISCGSLLFPQADVGITVTSQGGEDSFPLAALLIAIGIVIAAGGGIAVFLFLRTRQEVCEISVLITKSNPHDNEGIGTSYWRFLPDKVFRVGRVLNPMQSDGRPMEPNNFVIYEGADKTADNAIGRHAFEIQYDKKSGHFNIVNNAQKAIFYIQYGEDAEEKPVEPKSVMYLSVGTKILVGNYTTVTINSLEKKICNKKDLKGL